MKKFEYRTSWDIPFVNVGFVLEEFGQVGWEAYHIKEFGIFDKKARIYFKREII